MSLHENCEPGCRKTHAGDPAYDLLVNPNIYSTPKIFRKGCYICEDPEFAQLGMPLCNPCCNCKDGHVPADQGSCDDCQYECWPECQNEHDWDHPNGKNPKPSIAIDGYDVVNNHEAERMTYELIGDMQNDQNK